MTRSQVQLQFLGTSPFALDVMLTYPRQYIRHIFQPGEKLDVTNTATAGEIAANSVMADLLNPSRPTTGALFSLLVTPGGASGFDAPTVAVGNLASEASNQGVPGLVRVVMTAGNGSAADDVTFVMPFKGRIVGVRGLISTLSATASQTVQLWDTAGGTGVRLSGAIKAGSADTLGPVAETAASFTASAVVASGATVFCHRGAAHNDIAGELFVSILREP